jgi:hypothetical protein
MKKSAKPKETLGSRPSESRSLSERYAELLELREMNDAFSRVFTIEVDGRPTLAFEASRTREATAVVPVGNSILLATDIESDDAPALCERSVA